MESQMMQVLTCEDNSVGMSLVEKKEKGWQNLSQLLSYDINVYTQQFSKVTINHDEIIYLM